MHTFIHGFGSFVKNENKTGRTVHKELFFSIFLVTTSTFSGLEHLKIWNILNCNMNHRFLIQITINSDWKLNWNLLES